MQSDELKELIVFWQKMDVNISSVNQFFNQYPSDMIDKILNIHAYLASHKQSAILNKDIIWHLFQKNYEFINLKIKMNNVLPSTTYDNHTLNQIIINNINALFGNIDNYTFLHNVFDLKIGDNHFISKIKDIYFEG